MINTTPVFTRVYQGVVKEFRFADGTEFMNEILQVSLKRERILSYILIVIDIILLGIDMYISKMWTRDLHIFGQFSYLHVILLLIPCGFLTLFQLSGCIRRPGFTVHRLLNGLIPFCILILCSLISVNNHMVNKLPYAYIIAMFCMASLILLPLIERYIVYFSSYLVFVLGSMGSWKETIDLAANVFFVTLLVIIALVISHINYTSFVNLYLSKKIIMEKNKELDRLYKTTEETLKERTRQLHETMEYEQLRVAFFANLSHELRTPLAVMFSAQQMLEMLLKDTSIETSSHPEVYMKIIKQNNYRLNRLIDNLIDITKIDAGYFQIDFQNCDIVRVVEDITQSVAKYIEDRDLGLTFDTQFEEMIVACDPDKIERVILNLLSNAVKFTPTGGHIYVNIWDNEMCVLISIKDTGIGIPEEIQGIIFDRFIQADKTTSRSREGSGIGLSIVKSLVEMHHGTIQLRSKRNEGTEFIISLPKRSEDNYAKHYDQNIARDSQHIEKIRIEFSDIYR